MDAFGKPAEEIFAEFDPHPMAQASIGQVHRAVLKTGEKVVVKVQYPQIKKAVASDLKGLDSLDGLLGKLFPSKPNLDTTIEELKETLINECDYLLEQKNILYASETLGKEFPQILIPKVYPEYSTATILTMEEMKGMSFDETLKASQAQRNTWGQILYDASMYGLYKNLFLHTDPQNGNYLFTKDKIILLDFGSCRFFPQEFVRDYTLLLRSLEIRSFVDYSAWMKRMGYFTDKDGEEIIREHYNMIGDLYWPYTQTGIFALQSKNPFEQARNFIKKVSLKDRKAPRPEFILLDRSNLGLYTKLKSWRSEIDWVSARDHYRLAKNF
jgi:aarF domain-containing kinase